MKKFEVEINNEGQILINKVVINEEIFFGEKYNYTLRNREDFIDTLIDWISETDRDKEIMKNDLKYLMKLNDEYIWSSISTNLYIAESDCPKSFNKICEDILKLNKEMKDE